MLSRLLNWNRSCVMCGKHIHQYNHHYNIIITEGKFLMKLQPSSLTILKHYLTCGSSRSLNSTLSNNTIRSSWSPWSGVSLWTNSTLWTLRTRETRLASDALKPWLTYATWVARLSNKAGKSNRSSESRCSSPSSRSWLSNLTSQSRPSRAPSESIWSCKSRYSISSTISWLSCSRKTTTSTATSDSRHYYEQCNFTSTAHDKASK